MTQLTDRLEEREALNVTHGPANFAENEIDSLARIAVQGVMLEDADPTTALVNAVDDFEFNK